MIAAALWTGGPIHPTCSVLGPHLLAVLPGKGADAAADAMLSRLEFGLALLDRRLHLLAPHLWVHASGGGRQHAAARHRQGGRGQPNHGLPAHR